MEYMEHGSLYDILHNETMLLDGDLILPMLQDIVQGIRFLHTVSLSTLEELVPSFGHTSHPLCSCFAFRPTRKLSMAI